VVFHFVCVAWIFFRADDYDTVLTYLTTMARLTPGVSQASMFTVGLIGLGLAMQFVPNDLPQRLANWLVTVPDWTLATASGLALVAIAAMGPDGIAPFIYFQF
jgi:alginate O-acetyltransferase complex protein AlgI